MKGQFNLNFFDIYGYVIPGIFMVALTYAPFGIMTSSWPDPTLGEAVAWLVIAYAVGLLLQSLAHFNLPSGRVINGTWRKPADYVLTEKGRYGSLPASTAEEVLEWWQRDSGQPLLRKDGETPSAVLLKCRSLLKAIGQHEYTEQFNGMYVLSRGLAMSSFLTAFFCFGIVLAAPKAMDYAPGLNLRSAAAGVLILGLLVVSLLQRRAVDIQLGYEPARIGDPLSPALLRERLSSWLAWHRPRLVSFWIPMSLTAVLGGLWAGVALLQTWTQAALVLVLGFGLLLAGLRFRSGNIAHFDNFVATCYRDFAVALRLGAVDGSTRRRQTGSRTTRKSAKRTATRKRPRARKAHTRRSVRRG